MWVWVRRGLVLLGCLFLFAMIPASCAPSISSGTITKHDQTIAVPQNAGDISGKIRDACRAPFPMRMVMASAKHVNIVTFADNGVPIRVQRKSCKGVK